MTSDHVDCAVVLETLCFVSVWGVAATAAVPLALSAPHARVSTSAQLAQPLTDAHATTSLCYIRYVDCRGYGFALLHQTVLLLQLQEVLDVLQAGSNFLYMKAPAHKHAEP